MASSDLNPVLGHAGHPAPGRHETSNALLTFALAAAPLAWMVQTTLNYVVASRACYPFTTRLLHNVGVALWPILIVATVAAFVIGCVAYEVAWRAWRKTRAEHHGGGDQAMEVGEGRTRFLALAGMMVSMLFVAAVVFNAVGLFVVPPCG
jgi:hypothetical protein